MDAEDPAASEELDRRAAERPDRRAGERRRSDVSVVAERRLEDRRRLPRRLVDVFRSFLGLPPLE